MIKRYYLFKRYLLKLFLPMILCILMCMVLFGCGSKDVDYYVGAESETVLVKDESSKEEAKQASTEAEKMEEENISNIYIYLCGEVLNPGVYVLDTGSRLYDAIELAGGFTENACKDYWNLAELLEDGRMINIPSVEEASQLSNQAVGDNAKGEFEVDDGLLNINVATVTELTGLSGIGQSKAEAIVQYRSENGNFTSIDELTKVSGIGESTLQKIKDYIKI